MLKEPQTLLIETPDKEVRPATELLIQLKEKFPDYSDNQIT